MTSELLARGELTAAAQAKMEAEALERAAAALAWAAASPPPDADEALQHVW